jgi:hypothetical protein
MFRSLFIILISAIPVITSAQAAHDVGKYTPRQRDAGTDGYGYIESANAADIHKTVKYDKFKDVTFIHLEHPLNVIIGLGDLNRLLFDPSYHCGGDSSVCRPESIYLHFVAQGSEWRFIKSDRQLVLLLDGSRLPIGNLGWDGDTADSGYGITTYESMDISVPIKTFQRILTATVVEGELGHRTFTISSEHLKAMRSIYNFPPEIPRDPQRASPKRKSPPISSHP